MEVESGAFVEKARAALGDATLQHALKHIKHGFVEARANAAAKLPDFDAMRDRARDVKARRRDRRPQREATGQTSPTRSGRFNIELTITPATSNPPDR